MSTRCHIIVECPEWKTQTILYRHSDGYPEGQHGVLASLVPFVKRFMENRGWDPCYLPAQILADQIHQSREYMRRHYQESADEAKSTDMKDYYLKRLAESENDFLGFGISDQIHGDVEFIYRVTPAGIFVERPDGKKLTRGKEPARMMKEGRIPPRWKKD
jgi:hypothetical protein